MKTLNYTHLEEKGANTIVLSLQQLLADFQIHYANLRGFHWNIKGHGFFVLHSKFEDLYNGAAEKVDEIAERRAIMTESEKYNMDLKTCGGKTCVRVMKKQCNFFPMALYNKAANTLLSTPPDKAHKIFSLPTSDLIFLIK